MLGIIIFIISTLLIATIIKVAIYRRDTKEASRNPFMPDTKQIHDNILKNIDRSKTYADLINCHDWVMRNEFVLSPGQRANLIKKIREKEIKIEEGLSDIMGYPIGKIQ